MSNGLSPCPLVAAGYPCLGGAQNHKTGSASYQRCLESLQSRQSSGKSSDTSSYANPADDWSGNNQAYGFDANPEMDSFIRKHTKDNPYYEWVRTPSPGVMQVGMGARGTMEILENGRDSFQVSFVNAAGNQEWEADMNPQELQEALQGASGELNNAPIAGGRGPVRKRPRQNKGGFNSAGIRELENNIFRGWLQRLFR